MTCSSMYIHAFLPVALASKPLCSPNWQTKLNQSFTTHTQMSEFNVCGCNIGRPNVFLPPSHLYSPGTDDMAALLIVKVGQQALLPCVLFLPIVIGRNWVCAGDLSVVLFLTLTEGTDSPRPTPQPPQPTPEPPQSTPQPTQPTHQLPQSTPQPPQSTHQLPQSIPGQKGGLKHQ